MRLSTDDKLLLKELCLQHQVSYEKVLQLLDVIQRYEFKGRRIGVYDALREILKNHPQGEGMHEV